MNLKNVITIAKKEFFEFINSPLAYTIIVPFLLVSIFLYMRMVLVAGEATLRPFFEILPWFLLLLAPALSMKLLTDDYKSNTIELLYAHPITELEIISGKFFGVVLFFIAVLATTLSLPLTLFIYSRPDLGQIIGQYLGALLVASCFFSIGIAASSYVKNAVSSFLLSAVISFLLIIIGLDFILVMMPFPLNRIAAELAVITHMGNVARGLIDIRDVAYFFTITGVFLLAAVSKLAERKLVEKPKDRRILQVSMVVIVAIGIVANILLSFYPLRLDLTSSRLFTLSEGTKETIRNLPDVLTITVFTSRSLPAQMQLNSQNINDLLKDYQRLSNNIKVRTLFPDQDLDSANEAQAQGIREVTFNRIGSGKFEIQKGYLGLGVRFADKTEAIPFVADTSDLEYQLTRRIRKLTQDEEKVIGIYTNGQINTSLFDQLLRTQYETKNIDLGEEVSWEDFAALVVIDDGSQESTASASVSDYLEGGGKLFYLANGVFINPQTLVAQKSSTESGEFLQDLGVKINHDIVYDLQLNELLSFSGGNTQYLTPYPFWLRALPQEVNFTPLSNVKSISMGWPSSISLEEKEGYEYKVLLATSNAGGKQIDNFDIGPQSLNALTSESDTPINLAVAIENTETSVVILGTTSVVNDQFLQNNSDNVAFISNTVDYLAQDKDILAIPSKTAGRSVFEFTSKTDVLFVQYGNLLIPPALVIGFAIFYLRRRRKLSARIYAK